MLGGVQRHVDAGQRADLARPHAGAVDHDVGAHLAPSSVATPGDAPVLGADRRDAHVLDDAYARLARPARERLGGVDGIGLAVLRQVDRADHVVECEQRPALLRLPGGEFLHLEPETAAPSRRRA